jgi:hypothetical protein
MEGILTQRLILRCGAIALVIGLAGFFWQMQHRTAAPTAPVALSSSPMAEVVVSEGLPSIPEPEPLVVIEPSPPSVDSRSPTLEKAQPEQGGARERPEISAEEATEPILHLIPKWMLESGDVRRERVQVAGHWIDPVRSRYAWPNGSQVEVEVSDLGSDAKEEQFRSLGFDFDLSAEATDGALRVAMDGADYVSNLEYSEEDGSGHVQYIVAGRYLMEVQLERLPLESFQAMEDRDGLFAILQQHASEQMAR